MVYVFHYVVRVVFVVYRAVVVLLLNFPIVKSKSFFNGIPFRLLFPGEFNLQLFCWKHFCCWVKSLGRIDELKLIYPKVGIRVKRQTMRLYVGDGRRSKQTFQQGRPRIREIKGAGKWMSAPEQRAHFKAVHFTFINTEYNPFVWC